MAGLVQDWTERTESLKRLAERSEQRWDVAGYLKTTYKEMKSGESALTPAAALERATRSIRGDILSNEQLILRNDRDQLSSHQQPLLERFEQARKSAGVSMSLLYLRALEAQPGTTLAARKALVTQTALTFAKSISKPRNTLESEFSNGQRRAVYEWSHARNRELKLAISQQQNESETNERTDRLMSKTVQGFTSPEPRAEEYSRDRNRELFESAERKVISNIGESYPGISEDLQRFVDYVKATESKLLPPEIYSRAAELHSADIVSQRRSEDKSREPETPQEQQDQGISF